MRYYRFATFRTSYYFPDTTADTRWLYGVYHPYGSLLVKFYWWLFTHCRLVRMASSVDSSKLDFPYGAIMNCCMPGAVASFNLGTPGEEQKISMLGYVARTGESFFAKYSTKEKAKALSRNEIRVLKRLEGMRLSPSLLSVVEDEKEDGSVFFSTTRAAGRAYASFELTDRIMDILCNMSGLRLEDTDNDVCLSHGDFCPWNMIEQENGDISLIDWEMAADRPYGYDLFMLTIHAPLVMGATNTKIIASLESYKYRIEEYFKRSRAAFPPRHYLLAFLNLRLREEETKEHLSMANSYKALLAFYS